MEFSRQEYWSGCHSFLQGIFPNQGSSPGLLQLQEDSLTSEPDYWSSGLWVFGSMIIFPWCGQVICLNKTEIYWELSVFVHAQFQGCDFMMISLKYPWKTTAYRNCSGHNAGESGLISQGGESLMGFLELLQEPGVYSRVTAGMSIRNSSLFIEVRNLSRYEGQLRNVN